MVGHCFTVPTTLYNVFWGIGDHGAPFSTTEFGSFDLNGAAGNLLTLGSTNTTQAILKKPGAWNVGANSVDAGNNTGLSFI